MNDESTLPSEPLSFEKLTHTYPTAKNTIKLPLKLKDILVYMYKDGEI